MHTCTDRTHGDKDALGATFQLLSLVYGCKNTPLHLSLPATEYMTPPPLHRHRQSLFTGTICPINVRSQHTVSPLISPLDLNKGRSLTNCCLETQQDASIMGFIQKTARPSSDLSCPLCGASELRLQIVQRFEGICFWVSVLLSKTTFISQRSLSSLLLSCSNFAYLLNLTKQIVLADVDSYVWFLLFSVFFPFIFPPRLSWCVSSDGI